MEKDFSIIIPAYNAEKTIKYCLDSIFNESVIDLDFEVIVVNDGSRDNTSKILKEYIPSDRLVIIDKENGGVSSARNRGLKCARGKYVYFLDADDTIFMEALIDAVKLMEELHVDLAITDFDFYDTITSKRTRAQLDFQPNVKGERDAVNKVFHDLVLRKAQGLASVCNKVLLRQKLIDNNIWFNESLAHAEDWFVTVDYLEKTNSLVYVNKSIFTYLLNGSQDWSKYTKGLIYGLTVGRDRILELNKKLKFLTDEEELLYLAIYLTQINRFVCLENISFKEKKQFLKSKTVKEAVSQAFKLNSKELEKIQLSRKDKLVFLYIKLGFYKKAIEKMIKRG